MIKKLSSLIIFLLIIALVFAAYNSPRMIGHVNAQDKIIQCYKTQKNNWECVKGIGLQGFVEYDIVGTNPKLVQEYKRGKTQYTDIQIKLNGFNGMPGNNGLAKSAWKTEDSYDGGCWVSAVAASSWNDKNPNNPILVEGENFVNDPGISCNELGGEGYRVLGFEKIPLRFNKLSSRVKYTYDLSEYLIPGFYYVKALVTRNGAINDGSIHSGDGSKDYSLLLAEKNEPNTPLYFGIAPKII